ncbi:MAG: hypothetical protein WC809_19285 [Sinimarinibacterium sp.]|jgi:hypothetical protein
MIDSPARFSVMPARTARVDSDACNPDVSLDGEDLLVAMYGRPFKVTEADARQLAWGLISKIEELRRQRLC